MLAPSFVGPILRRRQVIPSTLLADSDDDVATTVTNVTEAIPLTEETVQRMAVTIGGVAQRAHILVGQACRVVQNGEQPPPYTAADAARALLEAQPIDEIRIAILFFVYFSFVLWSTLDDG